MDKDMSLVPYNVVGSSVYEIFFLTYFYTSLN